MQNNESALQIAQALGLQESELRVYAALSVLGGADATRLATKVEMPRTTIYSIVDRLIEVGLVSKEKNAHGQRFIPASSAALIRLAEERLQEAQSGVTAAKQFASILESAEGTDALTRSKIQLFEGKRSLDTMLNQYQSIWRRSFIETNSSWLGFQDDHFLQHYGHWIEKYWEENKNSRDANRDRVRLFCNESALEKSIKARVADTAKQRRELKALPKGIQFSCTIWVTGEYVTTIKTRGTPHQATVLRDKTLAENLARIFTFMWETT